MERILIVDTIIERNGKILMIKRNFDPGVSKFDLPGGFVDPDENIEEAAVREAKEETGLAIRIINKLGHFDYEERGQKTMHVFIGEIISGELRPSLEGTPVWMNPIMIQPGDLAFPQVHVEVLKKYGIHRRHK